MSPDDNTNTNPVVPEPTENSAALSDLEAAAAEVTNSVETPNNDMTASEVSSAPEGGDQSVTETDNDMVVDPSSPAESMTPAEPEIEEPIIPADPVPGSIGSAVSMEAPTEQPAVEQPAVEQPAVEQPAVEQSAIEEMPAAQVSAPEASVEQPVAPTVPKKSSSIAIVILSIALILVLGAIAYVLFFMQ